MKTPSVIAATLALTLCAVPVSASDADLCLAVDAGPGVDLTEPAAVRSGIVSGAIVVTEVVPCASGAEAPTSETSDETPTVELGDWRERATTLLEDTIDEMEYLSDDTGEMARTFRDVSRSFDDELDWIDANVPDPCFAPQWEDWRSGVSDAAGLFWDVAEALDNYDVDWLDAHMSDAGRMGEELGEAATASTDCY